MRTTVLIIGAGPAGCSSAIQLKRFGIDFLLVEMDTVGGLIRNANLVENYPGFVNGISGEKFASLLSKQLNNSNIDCTKDEIIEIKYEDGLFVSRGNLNSYFSDYVVIATGTIHDEPKGLIISKKANDLIFYEIVKLPEKVGKRICIIGSGDAAFDYALNLSAGNPQVDTFIRSDKAKALNILQERVKEQHNVTVRYNHKPIEIIDDSSSVRVLFESEGCKNEFSYDYIIFAIGRSANVPFLKIDESDKQNLLADEKLLFAGDVKNGLNRQCVIAAGDGNLVSMKIFKKIADESNTKNS